MFVRPSGNGPSMATYANNASNDSALSGGNPLRQVKFKATTISPTTSDLQGLQPCVHATGDNRTSAIKNRKIPQRGAHGTQPPSRPHGPPAWGRPDAGRQANRPTTQHNTPHPTAPPTAPTRTNDSPFSGWVIGAPAPRFPAKPPGGTPEMTPSTLTGSEAQKMCSTITFLLP